MHRILIVEDDEIIAQEMKNYLSIWGYEVHCAQKFDNIIPELKHFDPHLVLLDISLPFRNGYYWCSEIRSFSTLPIIFVSSASENMNIVMAINMGGDDFIAKPFDLNVLTAKVQAILRRSYSFNEDNNFLERNGVVLDLTTTDLNANGEKISLTKNDFKLIQILMEQPGEFVAREDIMARLWESDSFIDDNTLTVSMARLRKKLESSGLTRFIETKKGFGYRVI